MSSRRRRAFVTMLAIMLMALVAVAIAALTARVATAARQTTAARERAQVEQLILAGMEMSAGVEGERTIALPQTLAEDASLKVAVRGKRVEILARVGSTSLRQIVGQ